MILFIPVFISGCATPIPYGCIYTEIKLPVAATGTGITATKVGIAESKSILGLVAIGDASIEAAARQGGITKISHVDYKTENILGIIGKYTTRVYGK